MGERHHGYVRYDDSGKQSGGGPASISQRHLGSDVLTRICSEKKKWCCNVMQDMAEMRRVLGSTGGGREEESEEDGRRKGRGEDEEGKRRRWG